MVNDRTIADCIQKQYHNEIFQLISENAQDIITISTPEGIVEYISPSVHKLLGYEPDEMIGTMASENFHPEDVMKLAGSNILRDSDEDTFEIRVKHKTGCYIWFETTVKAIRDETGKMVKLISIGRDLSGRKQAEKEMSKTKEQLESFIKNNADSIWVVDLEDNVLDVNPSFERMFGWSAGEVAGKRLPIIPEHLKDSMDQIHQRIKSGETVVGLETIGQRKDGQLLDVEATLSPLRGRNEKIIGMTGICRNITWRKCAEEELKMKTSQLEAFIENHVDAIIIFNNEGVVQRVNKTFEEVFGWSKQEMMGLDIQSHPFYPEEYLDEYDQRCESIKKGQPVIGAETIRKNKNGDILNVTVTGFPIFDGRGNMSGWSVTLRDISELKKAQQLFQKSEKLSVAGQLAAGIAHEIRNPMTAIKGFIQLMKAEMSEKQQYFDIINSEIERIDLILSELLVLSKPQLVKYAKRDIRILVNQVLTLLESQVILNNVQFETKFNPGATHIYCDENQLKQVFINFMENSIESMPNGGKITIEVESGHQQELVIRLTDQGCGIPKDVLSKLGEPFYTTKEKGTGLGFMVSKKIIENHSGKIHVESELTKGTVIEITLPISFGSQIETA